MIILLNGPPRCGKDTAAGFVMKHLPSCVEYKMSSPLKYGVQNLYRMWNENIKYCNEYPDEPADILEGLTYRQAQIAMFHGLAAVHDITVLADLAIKYFNKQVVHKNIVVSDCGRTVEAEALRKAFPGRVALIQIRRDGCNYDNDIREDVKGSFTDPILIDNKYDLELYEAQIKRALKKWKLIED